LCLASVTPALGKTPTTGRSSEGSSDKTVEVREAQAAMQRFVSALNRRDLPGLLRAFPKSGEWYQVATTENADERLPRHRVTYATLKRGLEPDGDFIDFFFDGDDPFAMFVTETSARPWKHQANNKFVPPGAAHIPAVYVRWRKENGVFVIDEIGSPRS
jgi:hypothetical protein